MRVCMCGEHLSVQFCNNSCITCSGPNGCCWTHEVHVYIHTSVYAQDLMDAGLMIYIHTSVYAQDLMDTGLMKYTYTYIH